LGVFRFTDITELIESLQIEEFSWAPD
jgi:hypothetical protein